MSKNKHKYPNESSISFFKDQKVLEADEITKEIEMVEDKILPTEKEIIEITALTIENQTALPEEQSEIEELHKDEPAIDTSTVVIIDDKEPLLEPSESFGTKSKYFFVETMMTAGPRKSFPENAIEGDFGLGEDVAGALVQSDKVYFWVLDGTSDSPVLKMNNNKEEYFSSRLLAQSIAWELHDECSKWPEKKSILMLKEAIEATQVDWRSRIESLSETDKEALIKKLNIYQNIMCSTTVVFGSLDINGNLDVCRIGDSRIVTKPPHNKEDKAGRVFAILIDNGDHFELSFSPFEDAKCQSIEMEGVETIIAMSDGVSKLAEKWLNVITKLDFSDIKIRRTMAQMQHSTCDDKSMCIIQIKQ